MSGVQTVEAATLSEIARHLDLTPQTVQEAQREGRIGRNVDLATAESQWRANTDPNQAKKALGEAPGEADLLPLGRAKLEHERLKARLTAIEVARQEGAVVDVQAVREAGGDLAELVRQGLEQLVPALIQAVNGAKSAAMQDRAVRAVLERWRGEFATQVEQRCREVTTDA